MRANEAGEGQGPVEGGPQSPCICFSTPHRLSPLPICLSSTPQTNNRRANEAGEGQGLANGGPGGGGAAGAPQSASAPSSRPVHWPPPLFIPSDLDDLMDAPEAFR